MPAPLDRRALYDLGMSDAEIARRRGVHDSTIREWRLGQGLPSNGRTGTQPIGRTEEAERRKLYRLKWSDREIGNARGVSASTIQCWRRANGLAPNLKPGTSGGRPLGEAHERRMALYRRGMNDTKIAESTGSTPKAIARWRARQCLEAVGPGWERPATTIVSMDADLGEGGFNRHAFVADDAAAAWLEEMGATQW